MPRRTETVFLRAEQSPNLGKTIASVRDALRLSQRSLARRAGVNHRTVSRIERGQRPSPHTLQCIAGALGVEIEDLCPQWGKVMFSRQHGVALLGLGLRDVRLRAGVTMQIAAAAAGVSLATLSRFERGMFVVPRQIAARGGLGSADDDPVIVSEKLAKALGFGSAQALTEKCYEHRPAF